jgi:hypothetical protein
MLASPEAYAAIARILVELRSMGEVPEELGGTKVDAEFLIGELDAAGFRIVPAASA